MRSVFLIGCILIFVAEAFSQSFYSVRRERSLIFTAGTGTSTYFGELSNPGDYIDAKPNLNLGIQYFITERISARTEVTWFTLSGDDAKAKGEGGREARNLSFQSNNYEVSGTAAISLYQNGDRYYRRPKFNAYAFAGIGFMYFNPKTEYQGELVALQPLQTEGVNYSRFGLIIPFGLGVRLKVSPMFNFSLEGGWRKTFTDYLDDVSIRNYPDPTTLSSDLARALSNRGTAGVRGNPDSDDWYMLINAKVEYYLPWSLGLNQSAYGKKRKNFGKSYKAPKRRR